MCPSIPGHKNDNSLFPASLDSSSDQRSESYFSDNLSQEIKDQIFDLPSFLTPEQRHYVGAQLMKIDEPKLGKGISTLKFESEIEVQKSFIKLAKNYFDGKTLKFESEIEVQKLFIKLAKNYFDGKTTMKAIEYYENITRNQIDYICLKFKEFLFVTEGPDPKVEKLSKFFHR